MISVDNLTKELFGKAIKGYMGDKPWDRAKYQFSLLITRNAELREVLAKERGESASTIAAAAKLERRNSDLFELNKQLKAQIKSLEASLNEKSFFSRLFG